MKGLGMGYVRAKFVYTLVHWTQTPAAIFSQTPHSAGASTPYSQDMAPSDFFARRIKTL